MAEVLVIEDDHRLRNLASRVLTRSGHAVRLAADGETGLALYRDRAADVVVTDLTLPGKQGAETISELRQVHAEVRILAITGDYVGPGGLPGANAVLAKPFFPDELLEAVERLASTDEPESRRTDRVLS